MTVESATYITDLNTSYPEGGSDYADVDNHIRLVKGVLASSFPGVSGAVTATHTELNLLDGITGTVRTTSPIAGEWALMNSTTVTGGPSTVEFVHNSGGVTIDSTYDAFLITFSNLKSSGGTASLRVQISENASTYPANATGCHWQADDIASGSSTISSGSSQAYVQIGAGTLASSNPACSGYILILRPLSGSTTCPLFAESIANVLNPWTRVAGILGSTSAQFNAVRLALSGGTFAGSDARVRFYGRKV